MKAILKQVIGLLIGISAGFFIGAAIVILFTGTSFPEFIDKIRSTNIYEIIITCLVGIGAFILSIAVLITAHEAGHLVGGLLSGYKFISFRIFNFTFLRIDGKIKIKRFAVEGTGGQCLMLPPDLPVDKIPTALYNAGGVIANLLLLLISLPLFLFHLSPIATECLAIFCLTDGILILINGFPMKIGGIGNDAYNMLYLHKNLLSKRAFVLQLRINAMVQEGMRPKELPGQWFEWEKEIDYRNPIELVIPMMHASRLLDEMKWEEAYRNFNGLYSHREAIMPLLVKEIACELFFCCLLTGRQAMARDLLDVKLRKYIMDYRKVMTSKHRILFGIELMLENNRPEAERICRNLEATREKYLLKGEVRSDIEIMNHLLNLNQS